MFYCQNMHTMQYVHIQVFALRKKRVNFARKNFAK